MSIEKAEIYKANKNKKDKFMTVMFNPDTYTVDSKVAYESTSNPNARYEALIFTKVNARTLTLDLLFDATDVWQDMMASASIAANQLLSKTKLSARAYEDEGIAKYTAKLQELVNVEDDTGVPPIIVFKWGNFEFRGVVESLKENVSMFRENGVPVKSTVTISIREFLGSSLEFKGDLLAIEAAKKKAAENALSSSKATDLSTKATAIISTVV